MADTKLLHFYRRHGTRCEGERRLGSFSSESDERKRGWKKCSCPISASGTLDRFERRNSGVSDWDQARERFAAYEAAQSWDLAVPLPVPLPPRQKETNGSDRSVLIETATLAYLADHDQAHSAASTKKKYRILMQKLRDYSARIGVSYIDEWDTPMVKAFRGSWGQETKSGWKPNIPLTAEKKLGYLKAFFEFCVENGWTKDKKNPARIRAHRSRALRVGSSEARQRTPFSDEELRQMFDGCRDYGRTEVREWPKKRGGRQVTAVVPFRDYRRKWSGQDLEDFIMVSLFTGLRISDVATFHVDRLDAKGNCHVRTEKNGAKVSLPLDPEIVARIRGRAARFGPLVFGAHKTTNMDSITDFWRKKLIALWATCGPWKEKPAPHRFRHTFARILLQNGTSPSTVAKLMGDTEAVVRKYYSAWVPEVQDHMTSIMQSAFARAVRPSDPPRRNVVGIVKRG